MFNFDALLPAGCSLYPYQTCGVAAALLERRLILGDEMGLGKSVQALVAIEAAGAFPVVIACPASLKANWANELAHFLPHRQVFIASGKPSGRGAEIIIISYSLLHQWLPVFNDLGAVVFDESHYLSNPTRRRSKAALGLTKQVDPRGMVLCLTGTPFINKPVELVSQLKLIDGLHNLTPKPQASNDERAWAANFRKEWCGDVPSLQQLHRALCQTCYVRRQRRDVLGRSDTRRRLVTLSLDLAEYHEAEEDLISYLAERDGIEVAAQAMNAEGLSKLSHLRRLVGEAKLWAAREWVDDFLESNPDRSLVVFAYHKAVQRGLVDHFKCAHILGGEPDPEEQKRLFQSGASRIIVVSLTAGREGHTLTQASDVLFVELGWTHSIHAQAEARVNRIGQLSDDTFAWYLLGQDTIDQPVWEIIERKRLLFAAAAEGRGGEDDTEHSTAIGVLDYYHQREPHVGPAIHPASNIVQLRRKA